MDPITRVQNLYKADCISHNANGFEKIMYPPILS